MCLVQVMNWQLLILGIYDNLKVQNHLFIYFIFLVSLATSLRSTMSKEKIHNNIKIMPCQWKKVLTMTIISETISSIYSDVCAILPVHCIINISCTWVGVYYCIICYLISCLN